MPSGARETLITREPPTAKTSTILLGSAAFSLAGDRQTQQMLSSLLRRLLKSPGFCSVPSARESSLPALSPMESLRRRKLRADAPLAVKEVASPSENGSQPKRPISARVAAAKLSQMQKSTPALPETKPKQTRKRKVPVVHEEPAQISVPPPAAVMAEAPLPSPASAPAAAPAAIWTREMLSAAAEQLKVKDPGGLCADGSWCHAPLHSAQCCVCQLHWSCALVQYYSAMRMLTFTRGMMGILLHLIAEPLLGGIPPYPIQLRWNHPAAC